MFISATFSSTRSTGKKEQEKIPNEAHSTLFCIIPRTALGSPTRRVIPILEFGGCGQEGVGTSYIGKTIGAVEAENIQAGQIRRQASCEVRSSAGGASEACRGAYRVRTIRGSQRLTERCTHRCRFVLEGVRRIRKIDETRSVGSEEASLC